MSDAFLVTRVRGGLNHQGEGLKSDRPGDGVNSAVGFLEGSTLALREHDRELMSNWVAGSV